MGSGYAEGRDVFTGQQIRVHYSKELGITEIQSLDYELDPHQWIAPGLVDLQLNGCFGYDLNMGSLNAETVIALTHRLLRMGVTSYYPTIITNSDEAITYLLEKIAEACATDSLTDACIAGIHLEGPFISPDDGARGAHSLEHVKAPDWPLFCRWQQAGEGRIRIVTLSPEWENAPSFIRECVQSGVHVSLGHTSARSEQIELAVQAGARLCTHLGNGAHLQLPRHPNYIWDQLADDRLAPCVIGDGFHLPVNVLKVFLRAKPSQLMLVSDAVSFCGMPPGTYHSHIGGRVTLTKEGKLHVADQPGLLAGSAKHLLYGVQYLVQEGITDLATAWEMASVRPAAQLGLEAAQGLAVGAPADLVTFSCNETGIDIQRVIKAGGQID